MRISLNEIKTIEDFLLKKDSQSDRLLFEANLLVNRELEENVRVQEETYNLIAQYGRKILRKEIAHVHDELFTEPQHDWFRKTVLQLFSHKK